MQHYSSPASPLPSVCLQCFAIAYRFTKREEQEQEEVRAELPPCQAGHSLRFYSSVHQGTMQQLIGVWKCAKVLPNAETTKVLGN